MTWNRVAVSIAITVFAWGGLDAALYRKGDGGPAIKAEINGPSAIAIDHSGDIYVYEDYSGAIRRIEARSGSITTVVEECDPPWAKPRPTGCFGPISELRIGSPGKLLFSEFTYNRLSAFDLERRTLSVIAGTGDLRFYGDGGRATEAGISVPHCFTLDNRGDIFVCDSSHRVRRIAAETGIISTVAGSGRRGFAGDRGGALNAEFVTPLSVAVDGSENVYVSDDTSNRIRRIDGATGIIDTVAGSGPPDVGMVGQRGFSGEGQPATNAHLNQPRSLAFDHNGSLLFITTGRVCRIDKSGYLRTIAGVGEEGFSGDGGLATRARIAPTAMAVDDVGNVFLAEFDNNRVRRIDANSGVISTVAGNGLPHRPPEPQM